jgi:ubiquinone/menaquinone biosynthesis C-methylase UbiE
LSDKIKIIKGNVKQIGIADEKVDLIFSNELFCDLDRSSSELTLKEFYRILKHGGQMVHAELDPKAENKAQELLIKADIHYSLESLPFEGERWFSPTANGLSTLIHNNGFTNIQVSYFKTNLKLGYEATVEQLKRWKIDMAFVKEYSNELREYGMEYPKEHVIKCVKR